MCNYLFKYAIKLNRIQGQTLEPGAYTHNHYNHDIFLLIVKLHTIYKDITGITFIVN